MNYEQEFLIKQAIKMLENADDDIKKLVNSTSHKGNYAVMYGALVQLVKDATEKIKKTI